MLKDSQQDAREAGLTYVDDWEGAIRRKSTDEGFVYLDADGAPVKDTQVMERIASLAIPPAWSGVLICPDRDGHLQAVGRDARGRKQYLYHPRWIELRSQSKFDGLLRFLEALPSIRSRVAQDLALSGFPKDKVLALLVRLLEATLIRVGSERYARENSSFGLTTLTSEHLDESCPGLCLIFSGKRGKQTRVDLRDKAMVRMIRDIQELPGQRLFQYVDEHGAVVQIGSSDLNEYLKRVSGSEITAKDFRTWGGSLLAAAHLEEIGRPETAAGRKRAVNEAVRRVARILNNTPAVCRKYYIHPGLLDAFERGTLPGMLVAGRKRVERGRSRLSPIEEGLRAIVARSAAGV
jgi:DNA topoisomerase I